MPRSSVDNKRPLRHSIPMAEIVNLRTARKAKARSEKQNRAGANRALYGRTPAEKARDAAAAERHDRQLDQAKREFDK